MEPPEIAQAAIHWGVHEDFRIRLPSSMALNYVPLTRYEYLLIAMTHIARYERQIVKEEARIRLSAAVYDPEYDIIIGVAATTGMFVIMRRTDLAHPLSSDVRAKQVGIFHLIYSKKSGVLITIGQDLRIWNFKCEIPDRRLLYLRAKITITLRKIIDLSPDSTFLNPPPFDYKSECIYLPSSEGFVKTDLDGRKRGLASHLPSDFRTAACFNQTEEALLTADPIEGICEWNWSSNLNVRHRVSNASIVAVRFINKEFIFYIDTKLHLNILDLGTSRIYAVTELLAKPVSFVYFENPEPSLAICIGQFLTVYRVVIPWKLWCVNVLKARMIKLVKKENEASRIVIHSANAYLTLVAPRNSYTLTSAAPDDPKPIESFFYHRVNTEAESRDQIFTIQEGGKVSLFATGDVPCRLVATFDLQATAIMNVMYEDRQFYCVAAMHGELMLCDYNTMECKKRFFVSPDKVHAALYDSVYGTIVLFMGTDIVRFSLAKKAVIQRTKLKMGSVVKIFRNLVVVGHDDGMIIPITLTPTEMIINREGIIGHWDTITGIAFGRNFIVTGSLDCTVKIWSYSFALIATVNLPLRIYSVEILNGKRDILAATESEVMLIYGNMIFGKEYEREDPVFDNFNRKRDELSEDVMNMTTEEDVPVQEDILDRKPDWLEANRANLNIGPSMARMRNQRAANIKMQPSVTTKKDIVIDEAEKKKKIMEMLQMTDPSLQKPVPVFEREKPEEPEKPPEETEAEENGKENEEAHEEEKRPTKRRRSKRLSSSEVNAKDVLFAMTKRRKSRQKSQVQEREIPPPDPEPEENVVIEVNEPVKKHHFSLEEPVEEPEPEFHFSSDDGETKVEVEVPIRRESRPRIRNRGLTAPIQPVMAGSFGAEERNVSTIQDTSDDESESSVVQVDPPKRSSNSRRKPKRKAAAQRKDSTEDNTAPKSDKDSSTEAREPSSGKPRRGSSSVKPGNDKKPRRKVRKQSDIENTRDEFPVEQIKPDIQLTTPKKTNPARKQFDPQNPVAIPNENQEEDEDVAVPTRIAFEKLRTLSPPPVSKTCKINFSLSCPAGLLMRSRTPPSHREKRLYVMPIPCIRLDNEAVIRRYISGDETMSRLVERMKQDDYEGFLECARKAAEERDLIAPPFYHTTSLRELPRRHPTPSCMSEEIDISVTDSCHDIHKFTVNMTPIRTHVEDDVVVEREPPCDTFEEDDSFYTTTPAVVMIAGNEEEDKSPEFDYIEKKEQEFSVTMPQEMNIRPFRARRRHAMSRREYFGEDKLYQVWNPDELARRPKSARNRQNSHDCELENLEDALRKSLTVKKLVKPTLGKTVPVKPRRGQLY